MALTGQALQDKLLKDATRLFAFSSLCPREDSPYRFKALLIVEALNGVAAAKAETDDAFVELQKKYPNEIENFKVQAEREYNAYCEQMRAQAARRYHRGGYNRSYCYR